VKEVDQQIANTQTALTQAQALTSTEEATDVNPLRQAVERELATAEVSAETAQTKHDVVARQIEQQRRAMAQLDSSTTEHDNLEREVKRLEQNYNLYSARREEARISDAMDKQRIANVVVAEAPVVPSLPKPKLSGGLAGVFLLGCAVILATTFAAGGNHQTFETAWELEAFTVMPVLATLAHDGDRHAEARSPIAARSHDLAISGGD
jgi:polysaccharide biosynthesis protein PslE